MMTFAFLVGWRDALSSERSLYRIEELMQDMEELAAAEGLEDRFARFRAECDRNIVEIAQARLGIVAEDDDEPDEGE